MVFASWPDPQTRPGLKVPNRANLLVMRTRTPFLSSIILPALLATACTVGPPQCVTSGGWVDPGTLHRVEDPIASSARHQVILLGEAHDRAADHRWELDTIAHVYAADPSLVLGFEMFPRSDQPALDEWLRGGQSEADFLARSDWKHVWGFDAALYMPIFRFARDHHVPMIALNVSSRTIHLVSAHGSAGVPSADREGVSVPAPPAPAYRAELAEVMGGHSGMVVTPDRLDHFIDAQLTWDRAMAEAIAAQRKRMPARPVVAIMGAGHLENRYGVPHQLDALGLSGALVLLPAHGLSAPPGDGYADAVYVEPPANGGICNQEPRGD